VTKSNLSLGEETISSLINSLGNINATVLQVGIEKNVNKAGKNVRKTPLFYFDNRSNVLLY
jgi:hypothetical protein